MTKSLLRGRAEHFLALVLISAVAPVTQAAPVPVFTSRFERYSINFPGELKSATRLMSLPKMGQIKVHFVTASKPPVTCIVIPMKLPSTPSGARSEQFLDGVERGFTMSTSAKLLSRKKISLNGAPGREIVVQAGRNLLRGRFFVKGNRSYQVVVVAPKNAAAKYDSQIIQVLNSFRILG